MVFSELFQTVGSNVKQAYYPFLCGVSINAFNLFISWCCAIPNELLGKKPETDKMPQILYRYSPTDQTENVKK